MGPQTAARAETEADGDVRAWWPASLHPQNDESFAECHSVCFASIYRATIIQHLSRIDSSCESLPVKLVFPPSL